MLVKLLHKESLFQNTGLSFSERIYTLDPIHMECLGEDSSATLPTYLDAETYSMFGITPTESITGTITVTVAYINLPGSCDYGYYVESVTVNPTYGKAFIQALSSEPLIHYICDWINSNQVKLSEGVTKHLELPKFMEVYLPKNAAPVSVGGVEYAVVENFDLNIEVVMTDVSFVFFNDPKCSLSLYHYRNFDGYVLGGNYYVSGDELLASDNSDIIEKAFHQVDFRLYTKESYSDWEDTAETNYCLQKPVFFYSGETYELKTPGTISLSHAVKYPDIVADLLGRLSVRSIRERDVLSCASEFDLVYRKYINAFGIGVEECLDRSLVTALLSDNGIFSINLDSNHNNGAFETIYKHDDADLDYVQSVVGTTYSVLKHYFCPIAERINICKELINLGFPTVDPDPDAYKDYLNNLGSKGVANAPLWYLINTKDKYGFSSLVTGNLEDYKKFRRRLSVDNQDSVTKEMVNFNKILLTERDSDMAKQCVATYTTSDFANVGGEPVSLEYQSSYSHHVKEKYIFPLNTIGDTLVMTAVPLLSAELYVDVKQLKTIMLHIQKHFVNLTGITDTVCSIDVEKCKNKYISSLKNIPSKWKGLQRPRNLEYTPASSSHKLSDDEDSILFTYDLVEQTISVTYSSENSQVPGLTCFDAAKRIKAYNNDLDTAYAYPSYAYEIDPAHGIRSAYNKDRARRNKNNVDSFGYTATTSSKSYSLDDYLPTNYYTPTEASDLSRGLVYPLFGSYALVTAPINKDPTYPTDLVRFLDKNTNKISALEELMVGYKHKNVEESGWF